MPPVVIVFAKAPIAGRTKTRLTPAVSPADAAVLHDAFVRDTLRNLLDFAHAQVELHTDVKTDAWSGLPVPRRLQHEGDLGLKMFHALRAALEAGHPRAMILGSDVPDLPSDHIASLLQLDADIALGGCSDGGYWGIAARRVHPRMFDGVEWSSGRERQQTIAACRACGFSVANGRSWDDVDTPEDLVRLKDSRSAPASASEINRIGLK